MLYNETFAPDRERNSHSDKVGDHLSMWIDNLTCDMMDTSESLMDNMENMMVDHSASLEEITSPQDLESVTMYPGADIGNMSSENSLLSPISPSSTSLPSSGSVTSVDNIIDQR